MSSFMGNGFGLVFNGYKYLLILIRYLLIYTCFQKEFYNIKRLQMYFMYIGNGFDLVFNGCKYLIILITYIHIHLFFR